MGKKQRRETRKRKKSPGKENGTAPREKKYSAQTKQFPGCYKRPKVSGTADLSISYVDSSDDEIILDASNKNSKMRNIKERQVTSSCNSGENCQSVQVSESNNYSSTSRKKNGSTCSEVRLNTNVIPDDISQSLSSGLEKDEASKKIQRPKCNNQYAKEAGGHVRKGNLSSQLTKKSSASANTSSVVTCNLAAAGASASAEREQDQLQDDAFALLLHLSTDTGGSAAVVAEQRMLEARLRQEAEDAKLARRLQRHLATVTVDRTQGSGEEYQLRPRRRRCSPAPAPEARAARGASPCY